MFGVAAVVMVLLAVVVRLGLPVGPADRVADLPAAAALGARRWCATSPSCGAGWCSAAVGMGCFTILWTAVDFLLSAPPYGYGPAIDRPVRARRASPGRPRRRWPASSPTAGTAGSSSPLALVVLAGSWALLGLGGASLAALIAGIVVLDLAQQTLQISHQSVIYALAPQARSRVTTAYMTSAFLGGTLASAATSVVYPAAGWTGVCVLGGALAVVGLGRLVPAPLRERSSGL